MSDIRRIRVLWPDHLGLPRGKYLPPHLADRGTRHAITLFGLTYDRDMVPAPGAMMFEGMPDMECRFDPTEVRLGWENGVGVVVGDLEREGAPLPLAPRHVLANAIDEWKELGYTPQIGIEFEAYLMEPDGDGWKPYHCPGSFVYGTGPLNDPAGIVNMIHDTADQVGFRLESVNTEFDAAQFEFTLEYDNAMAAADEAFLFKAMARDVAYELGYLLTFMPKPIIDRGGSGLHINLSLLDADGNNALLDPSTDDGLSVLAKQCIAGQLHHMSAMTALCAPTANSYKRLQPGQLSGYWKNWGHDHRCATVRVNPERDQSTRLENRMPDGSATIHTVVAAVLTAARLGVEAGLECPDPETGDALEAACTEEHSPDDLSEALAALESDSTLANAIGREMVDQFMAVKAVEWEKYVTAVGDTDSARDMVTDWENDTYLPYI
ncbi:MAG: glutamine synthetase [Acidimicrobiia bacterium]|nr:glutamine synthetase [Actinomycetota bacterium]MBL6924585.1 glutamine synthetase [Acidimicrobiia bacterium]